MLNIMTNSSQIAPQRLQPPFALPKNTAAPKARGETDFPFISLEKGRARFAACFLQSVVMNQRSKSNDRCAYHSSNMGEEFFR